MAKETRLNDTADIYTKRENQTEKQKLGDMTITEKFQYFKDYYFKKIFMVCLLSGIAIWFLYTVLSPKTETVLYAAIINDALDNEKTDVLTKELEQYYKINPEKQEIVLDYNFYIDEENGGTETTASVQKLGTYVAAEQIDVIITDEKTFQGYAYNGYFVDLADQLPTDLYSNLSDSFFMSETDEKKTEKNAYGVYLTDCEKYKNLGSMIEKPVIGIVANSKYRENGADFIKYLYDLK